MLVGSGWILVLLERMHRHAVGTEETHVEYGAWLALAAVTISSVRMRSALD